MALFHFRNDWIFDADAATLWRLASDCSDYPRWWPGFASAVRLGDGDDFTFRVRGDFGLVLDFAQHTTSRAGDHWRFDVSGDLRGSGAWDVRELTPGRTQAQFRFDVELTSKLWRLVARVPALRRRMERSHTRVMEAGRRSLERMLRAAAA